MTPDEFNMMTNHVMYQHRGAFFSELYLFVSLCLERGVTRIVESGVYHGVSTRVFRAIWPDRVVSIDAKPEQVADDLADVITGDGCVLVPAAIRLSRDDATGVFIDGPKGAAAVALRQWCLRQPHVKVVAQHDSPVGSGELMHSYDKTFRRTVGDLVDARISPEWRAHYVNGCPGMGVWVSA